MTEPGLTPAEETELRRKKYQAKYYQDHKTKASAYQARYRKKLNAERRKPEPMPRRDKDIAYTPNMILNLTPDKLVHVIGDILDPSSERVFTGVR